MGFKFLTVFCLCFHAVLLSAIGNNMNEKYLKEKKMSKRLSFNDLLGTNLLNDIKQQLPGNLIDSNSIDFIKNQIGSNSTDYIKNLVPSNLIDSNSIDFIKNLPSDLIDYAEKHFPSDILSINSTDDIKNLLPSDLTDSIDDLKNQLIMLFIEKASQLNFLNLFTNYLASLGVNIYFVNPNLIEVNVNASQNINIRIDNDSLFDNWVYINKNFSLNVPDYTQLLILTQCFRSDGKQLMWNQYWINPIDLFVYSFNLVDYVQLNAGISYNCLFNYSYVSSTISTISPASTTISTTTTTLNSTSLTTSSVNNITITTVIPISSVTSTSISYSTKPITTNPTSLRIVNLELSLKLTFVSDYYNLSSSKSSQLIHNFNSFVS